MFFRRFVLGAVLSVLSIPALARGDDRCAGAILRHGTDLFVGTKDIEAHCERRQLFAPSDVGCPPARDSRRIGELITCVTCVAGSVVDDVVATGF